MKYFLYCRKSTEAEDRQVMSLDSQRGELERAFGAHADVEIVEVITEAKSAKEPGRPLFNQMIARIEAGEAQGVVAWAPDRLARNSIDGGRLVYLLDRNVLRDLKFASYTFENNSQGKFMLAIMFGQSKYYSDNLSEVVKRGNRTKVAGGWRPGSAPIGYLNDGATKTIVVDPQYAPLVREMFNLVLSGGKSAREIARIAREEWELRTPKRRRGGGVVHESMVHRLLTNPFYAGLFTWDGQLVQGRHQALVSMDEFQAVQARIRRPGVQRQQRHFFPFTGLIRCGACGRAITAQHSTNRFGSRYIYYRCTRRGYGMRCRQPSVRAEVLEAQIAAWLSELPKGSDVEARLEQMLRARGGDVSATKRAVRDGVERGIAETQSRLKELTDLRLRRLVDDEEFLAQRASLQSELLRLTSKAKEAINLSERFKPFEAAIPFSNHAADWFSEGDDQLKRQIMAAAGSNPVLIDKKLNVGAAKWLMLLHYLSLCPSRLGLRDDVQTLVSTSNSDPVLVDHMEALHEDAEALAQLKRAGDVAAIMEAKRQQNGLRQVP